MEYVDRARATTERGELVLRERRDPAGDDGPGVLELRVNGVFVMDTVETTSEKALATVALKQVENPRAVLVAGLGLGFTMHEVLADHRVERLVVVEIEDTLVQWMRDGTIPHGPAFFADERLTVISADIRVVMAEATQAAYDLVVLDVDNGPDYLVYDDNEAVYGSDFLALTKRALRPGGAVAIWSAAESESLSAELERVFGKAVAVPHDVTLQGRDERYWLYLARR